jgi:hypothetical protein
MAHAMGLEHRHKRFGPVHRVGHGSCLAFGLVSGAMRLRHGLTGKSGFRMTATIGAPRKALRSPVQPDVIGEDPEQQPD